MKSIPKLLQLMRDNARAEGQAQPIRTEVAADQAHVYLYDVIDPWFGATATALVEALKAAGDRPVQLHINSPGGDVFEGTAMASAIAAHTAPVVAVIDGVAASAATRVALAASHVQIADSGLFMIHRSWTMAWGNEADLGATADLLRKVDGTIAADYVRKTAATLDQVQAWMNAETWFNAAEALAAGFVDEVLQAAQPQDQPAASAARWNLSAYANAPKLAAPTPPAEDPAQLAQRQQRLNRSRLALLQQSI